MRDKKIEVVLIDLDILRYELGSLTEKHPFVKTVEQPLAINLLENKVHERIAGILLATGTEKYEGFLTGPNNWRIKHAVQEPYKGQRILPKPANWGEVDKILKRDYNSTITEGFEADDLLAIKQREYMANGIVSCIASRDKDLDTCSGWRYRWKAGKHQPERLYYLTEFEATKHFYTQILTGDTIDNIGGCSYRRKRICAEGKDKGLGYMRRYGIKGSKKLIDACTTEFEMYQVCLEQYTKKFSEREALPIMLENAQLLWMGTRNLDELYQFPDFKEIL